MIRALTAAAILCVATAASPSLDAIVARLEALEKENADLRAAASTGRRLKFGTDKFGNPRQLEAATSSCSGWTPQEPILPGIFEGNARPHIILAQDIDYPPYAFLGTATEAFDVDGFGHDIAQALETVCDINITVVETRWSNCWDGSKTIPEAGAGLLKGYYHGCMTYTHTQGARNRVLEFSEPILQLNKPAGLIVRLDASGNPMVNGNSNLKGLRVVDVVGWAPTADTLDFVENTCPNAMGRFFQGFTFVPNTGNSTNANDAALQTLLAGDADAVWVYADQAYNYRCQNGTVSTGVYDCGLWTDTFGQPNGFAYMQTGLFGYARGGTTLSMHKKGSNLQAILDPCIQALKQTQTYYDICQQHGLTSSCYVNQYFPAGGRRLGEVPTEEHRRLGQAGASYETATNLLATTDCSTGYCPCPVAAGSDASR